MTRHADSSVPALADRSSPEQVRRIVQNAPEIDAHGEHADVAELSRLAREAGIDRTAMELGDRGALLEFELQYVVASLVAALSAAPLLGSPDGELPAGVVLVWLVVFLPGGATVWMRGRGGEEPEDSSPYGV